MALGAGKLFSGNDANRLRGGAPSIRRPVSVETALVNYKSLKYNISTPFANGATIQWVLNSSESIAPAMFDTSTTSINAGFAVTANTTIGADGNVTVDIPLNLLETSSLGANTSQLSFGIYKPGEFPGTPLAEADRTVNIVKNTQDLISGGNTSVLDIDAVTGSNVDLDVWFSDAVSQKSWDSTDFTHIRVHRYDAVDYAEGSTQSYDFEPKSYQGFNEPNFFVPVHVSVYSNGQYNDDLYNTTAPAVWMRYYNNSDSFNMTIGAVAAGIGQPVSLFRYRNVFGNIVSVVPDTTGTATPNGGIIPRITLVNYDFMGAYFSNSQSGIGIWYPTIGTDGNYLAFTGYAN